MKAVNTIDIGIAIAVGLVYKKSESIEYQFIEVSHLYKIKLGIPRNPKDSARKILGCSMKFQINLVFGRSRTESLWDSISL